MMLIVKKEKDTGKSKRKENILIRLNVLNVSHNLDPIRYMTYLTLLVKMLRLPKRILL